MRTHIDEVYSKVDRNVEERERCTDDQKRCVKGSIQEISTSNLRPCAAVRDQVALALKIERSI